MRQLFAVIALLTISVAPAWGVATPTAMDRSVSYGTTNQSDVRSSTSAGLFDENISADGPPPVQAFQISHIDPLFFGGSGGASASGSGAANALSVFDVTFELAVPHSFVLDGSLSSFDFGALAIAQFRFDGPGIFLFFSAFDDPLAFAESGVLAPGSYRLQATAEAGSGLESFISDNSWRFGLTLTDPTAVPEPLTCTLLALGVGALAFGARRMRAAPRR